MNSVTPIQLSLQLVEYGLCLCGCGQATKPALQNGHGYIKGEPQRFILGHRNRVRRPDCEQRMCECGCGKPTVLARSTSPRDGTVIGYPLRFIKGHNGRRPLADRFWEKVDTSGGPDACWPWTAGHYRHGYGAIGLGGRGTGKATASRLAWELTNGPIAAGLCVCHRCDNPPCCNPAHLWIGTQADNIADMIAKGRAGFSHD